MYPYLSLFARFYIYNPTTSHSSWEYREEGETFHATFYVSEGKKGRSRLQFFF